MEIDSGSGRMGFTIRHGRSDAQKRREQNRETDGRAENPGTANPKASVPSETTMSQADHEDGDPNRREHEGKEYVPQCGIGLHARPGARRRGDFKAGRRAGIELPGPLNQKGCLPASGDSNGVGLGGEYVLSLVFEDDPLRTDIAIKRLDR